MQAYFQLDKMFRLVSILLPLYPVWRNEEAKNYLDLELFRREAFQTFKHAYIHMDFNMLELLQEHILKLLRFVYSFIFEGSPQCIIIFINFCVFTSLAFETSWMMLYDACMIFMLYVRFLWGKLCKCQFYKNTNTHSNIHIVLLASLAWFWISCTNLLVPERNLPFCHSSCLKGSRRVGVCLLLTRFSSAFPLSNASVEHGKNIMDDTY